MSSSGVNTVSQMSMAAIVLYWIVGAAQTGNWAMSMEMATALVALSSHMWEGLRPLFKAILAKRGIILPNGDSK